MAVQDSGEVHYLWWLALAGAMGVLFYLLGPILTPFLLAALVAYVCSPLVDALERRRFPRTLGTVLVLLLLAGILAVLLLFMLPMLIRQVRALANLAPYYVDWLRLSLEPMINRYFGIQPDVGFIKEWLVGHAAQLQDIAVKLLPSIKTGGLALIGLLINIVLIPVVLFYFLRDWKSITGHISIMVPRRWHARSHVIMGEIDAVLGQFFRGQLLVMLLMGVFYSVGLWLCGLDYALSVGMIAGLVTFVPYLGFIIGIVLATLTGLLQFQDYTALLWVWAVFGLGNLIEGYLLVPGLVGERIGLHPVAVIFALLAFGQLFGFFGVLLALPASAALLVGLRHLRQDYFDSGTYLRE